METLCFGWGTVHCACLMPFLFGFIFFQLKSLNMALFPLFFKFLFFCSVKPTNPGLLFFFYFFLLWSANHFAGSCYQCAFLMSSFCYITTKYHQCYILYIFKELQDLWIREWQVSLMCITFTCMPQSLIFSCKVWNFPWHFAVVRIGCGPHGCLRIFLTAGWGEQKHSRARAIQLKICRLEAITFF